MRSLASAYAQLTNTQRDGQVWVIDVQQLQTGDIILSTTASLVSLGIKVATRSNVSHAAVHVGNGFIVEAVSNGVRRINARSLIFPKPSYVKVLRPKKQASEQLRLVSQNARTLIDRPYSAVGAVGTLLPLVRQRDDPGRFCSQLVAESFERAELPLFPKGKNKPESVTPNDILKCDFLRDISKQGVIRQVRAGSMFHALAQMQPDWAHQNPNQNRKITSVSPEEFEWNILREASAIMESYSCFRKPYHYSDVLRQVRSSFHENKAAAQAVDKAVLEVVKKHDAALGAGVEPKATFPGLIASTPDPDLILMFDSGDHPNDAIETLRLREDILYGRSFDESEWSASVSDLKKLQADTDDELSSYTGILFWLLGDQGRMQATYHWLGMEN